MSRPRSAGFSRVDAAATPRRRSVGHQDGEALLAMPQPRTRTPRQKAEAAARAAAEQQDAARGVARWSMKDAPGCTGKACRSPEHTAGAAVRDGLLDVLGLLGDQYAKPP